MSAAGPFSARGARWLAVAGAASLLVAGLLAVFGDAFDVESFQADGFSRSAIGHHAAVALWKAAGRSVLVSRHATAGRLGENAVLVLAEPRVGADLAAREKLQAMLERAPATLLVLPKRRGAPDALHPGWLDSQNLRDPAEAKALLEAADLPGQVVRPKAVAAWTGALPAPTLEAPQLVVSDALEPLLATAEGVLVGRAEGPGGPVLVVADPDLLATHGLGQGDNAVIAVRLLEELGDPGTTVVVDETLHGHELQPSIVRELCSWPLVLATAQAALVLALAAWAALVRFGRPWREDAALAPGKAFLVENTADLLQHGGHGGAALAAYWRAAREHLARTLRRPGADGGPLDAWLGRAAAARGRGAELTGLRRRVAALAGRRRRGGDLVRAAQAIHRFREGMTHGSEPHP